MIDIGKIYCDNFDSNNIMFIEVEHELSLDEVIRLRNYLTSEIERVQKPVADFLTQVQSNTSPEI